jgi:MFS family permease
MNDVRETRQSWMILIAVTVAWSFSMLSLVLSLLPAITTFIEKDTGWSRTAVTGAMAMLVIAAALVSPWIGAVMDRRGARIVILWGQIIGIIMLAILGFAGHMMAVYYIGFAIAGAASAALTPTTYMRVISQWFDRRRGMAMGISALGSSFLAMALPLVAVQIATTQGWQMTFFVVAGGSLLLALPAQIFIIRDRYPPTPTVQRRGNMLRDTVRLWSTEPLVRSLIANFLLVGIAQTSVFFAIPALLIDRGMTPMAAAGAQMAGGAASLFGKLAGGFLLDYFKSAKPVMIGLAFAFIGILGFALGATGPTAYICAILMGLSLGIENDAPPYLVSRYFDIEIFGKVAGAITMVAILGLAIGPLGGSALRDMTGDYTATCFAALAILLFAAWLTSRLPVFPKSNATLNTRALAEAL